MKTAAGNAGGAMTGFMGMNMAGMTGGFNAQNLYAMGQQQQLRHSRWHNHSQIRPYPRLRQAVLLRQLTSGNAPAVLWFPVISARNAARKSLRHLQQMQAGPVPAAL